MVDFSRLTFVDAVADGFRRWRETSGRASRRAFWFWFLFTVLVSMVVLTVDSIVFPVSTIELPENLEDVTSAEMRAILDATLNDTVWSFSTLVSVALFVPTLTVTIRRFRDAGVATPLAWAVQLVNPVSTVLVFLLAYSMADSLDAIDSDAVIGPLALQMIAMLVIVVANVVGFVTWLVVAARPSRVSGTP